MMRRLASASVLSFAAFVMSCAGDGPPVADAGADGAEDGGEDTDTGFDTDTGTDTNDWVNPGCAAPKNVLSRIERLDVDVTLTDVTEQIFDLHEEITLVAPAAGEAVSLFGEKMILGWASAGYAYDDHTATFCTGPFEAGENVTVEANFRVVTSAQSPSPLGDFGLHSWEGGDDLVVGPFTEPFYAPYWLLVPQSLHAVDPVHDDSPAVDSVALSVTVPDSSWTVVGPGGEAEVDGLTWSFSTDTPMPLYALSFAASPSHHFFVVGTSGGGVEVRGAVTADKLNAAAVAFPPAVTAIDWMEQHIGPYAWNGPLVLAEVPGMGGGMEHVSGIWLGTSVITPDETGIFVAVHETVHHWWGDNVRFADWPHFWLAEGFDEWTTNFNVLGEILSPEAFAARKLDYRIEAADLTYPWLDFLPDPGPLRFADGDNMMDHWVYDLQLYYTYGAAFLEMVNQRLIRDFDTDLVEALAAWFDAKKLHSTTTEEFLAFLGETTGDLPYWQALFDDWVYETPCPTVELRDYSYEGGTARVTVARTDGSDQDMPGLEIVFVASGDAVSTSVDLPSGTNLATAQAEVPSAPERIAVDPSLFYVIRLETENGWNGPEVDFTLE